MNHHPHTPFAVAVAIACLSLASCSVQNDDYDAPAPRSPNLPESAGSSNPIYDSPAAYEHDSASAPLAAQPGLPEDPGAPPHAAPVHPQGLSQSEAPIPAEGGSTRIHTVVKGDTLSGMASKYGVTMDSIRAANRMTKDTVVLGRKMIIPER